MFIRRILENNIYQENDKVLIAGLEVLQ